MTRRRLAALCAALLLPLSGCGFTGIYDLPLPGGADLGDDPFELTVQFRDVLDLVPQSAVKVNEVAVGRVEDIELAADGRHADVTLLVDGDLNLPANALANVKMSSLLGEKYVELVHPPAASARGSLRDGAVIPVSRTNRNVEVEEVLGALSMLLNGGGVEQLNTITKELIDVYEGAGGAAELKAVLHNADDLVSGLDAQKDSIGRALDALAKLTGRLDDEKDRVAGALDDLAPGLQVLVDQRDELVTLLEKLDVLSDVAVGTVEGGGRDIVADLKALRPVLKNLADAGPDLPKSLELLVSFPFSDGAVDAVEGDYFNLFAEIDLDVEQMIAGFQRNRRHHLPGVPFVKELPMAEGEPFDPNNLPLPCYAELPPGSIPCIPTKGGDVDGLLERLIGGDG